MSAAFWKDRESGRHTAGPVTTPYKPVCDLHTAAVKSTGFKSRGNDGMLEVDTMKLIMQ